LLLWKCRKFVGCFIEVSDGRHMTPEFQARFVPMETGDTAPDKSCNVTLGLPINIPKNNTYTSVAASLTEELRLKLASGPSKLFTNSPSKIRKPDKATAHQDSKIILPVADLE
uniref:Uncharacterized protein n=1 Tax=Parascaris univalens TaxID=6257 RepID=A0A915AWU6_PARUN